MPHEAPSQAGGAFLLTAPPLDVMYHISSDRRCQRRFAVTCPGIEDPCSAMTPLAEIADPDLSRHHSLSDLVYSHLREEIMSGLWRPGERLTIRSQAARFRISPTPVRDAMLLLASEKALRLDTRAFAIPTLTKTAFVEIRRIRVALETLAAAEAARRQEEGLADRLDAVHTALAEAKQAGDIRGTMIFNRRFHFMLYAAAGMPQCFDMIQALWARAAPYQHNLYVRPPKQSALAHQHLRIIEAVRRVDPAETAGAVETDITERSTPLDDDLFDRAEDLFDRE